MIVPQVKIQSFRCFHTVEVELRPLTVLIGANDTGKSAFLAALRCLFHPSRGGLGVQPADFHRHRLDMAAMVLTKEVRWTSGVEGHVGLYQLPSSGIELTSRGHEGSLPPDLGEKGERVATLLDYLLRRDRKRFDQILEALRKHIPGLEDIGVSTPSAEVRSLELVVERGLSIDAARASTGLKVMLFFVALAFHPTPPDLILIEEPENGVHPRRLAEIIKLLRSITRGELSGHAAQIVLTTHSPYLLDGIDLDQDQVLVFQRKDDGTRTVEPADPQRLKKFLGEFQLGEVWFNEGERGLLAKPASS